MNKFWFNGPVIVALIVGLIIGFFIGLNWQTEPEAPIVVDDNQPTMEKKESLAAPDQTTPAAVKSAPVSGILEIEIADQPAGAAAYLNRVKTESAVWLAVREDVAGAPGNILGALRLAPGEYLGSAIELLRPTTAGGKYLIVAFADDGGPFDHAKNPPLAQNGDLVFGRFSAF